jgi:hypothetical protein
MERRDNMPLWVFLGLLNIESKKGALILVWACVAVSIICIPVSYYYDDWSYAGMMFAITPWYWLSMRWVDKNSSWEQISQTQTS